MVVENNLKLPRKDSKGSGGGGDGDGSGGGDGEGGKRGGEEYHALLWFDEDEDEQGQPRLTKVGGWCVLGDPVGVCAVWSMAG
jgi:hypothetical protein